MRILFFAILLVFTAKVLAMEIHGHRGMRGKWRENTLEAFEHALNSGAHVIECDVGITKDKILVVHHDAHLGTKELISNLTYAELKAKEPSVPTLEEVFTFLKSHPHIRLNCDIKRDTLHPHETLPVRIFAEELVNLAKKHNFSSRLYYTSFDPEILGCIRKLDSEAVLGFIYDKKTLEEIKRRGHGEKFILKMASRLKLSMLIPEHTLIKKEDVINYHDLGYRVVTWTVNDPVKWCELEHLGVDGIITDIPEEAIKVLKE